MMRSASRHLILLELVTIYSLVQTYIWRWQYTRPRIIWLILMALVASHFWHRDTPWSLGFRFDNFVAVTGRTALWAIPFFGVLLLAGFWTGRLWDLPLQSGALWASLRYTLWGLFQQYGLQGFFHNRLMAIVSDRLRSSAFNGIIFMSLHLPNPVLMVFTLLGGLVLSWLYAQSRNLFVLGIFHGMTGLLLSNTFPKAWLHNMRVGPGYFR
jgi:membrane protease YdiL (CAAX protease family)